MKNFLSLLEQSASKSLNYFIGFVRHIDGKSKYIILELNNEKYYRIYFSSDHDIKKNILFTIVKLEYEQYERDNFLLTNIEILVEFKTLFKSFSKKRNEIHIISNFSKLNSVIKLAELFYFLSRINVDKIAITDDSDVNSYFLCCELGKKYCINVIFGVETWYFNDLEKIKVNLNDEFIVVDIETNGLYAGNSEILEIGAYRFKNKQLLEKFEQLVKITHKIKSFITTLTGITEDMIKDKSSEKDVLLNFKKFIYKNISRDQPVNLVSHSNFDPDFLSARFKKFNINNVSFKTYDTLMLSKKIWPELSKYNLKFLSQHFNIELTSHHRALDDAKATAYLFSIILNNIKDKNNENLLFDTYKNYLFRIILLAKNLEGIKNIINILSIAHTQDYYKIARVRKSLINKYRENIIIIDPMYNGTISSHFLKCKDMKQTKQLYDWFDGIEMLSLDSTHKTLNFMMKSDKDYKHYLQTQKIDDQDITLSSVKTFLCELYKQHGNKMFLSSGCTYLFKNDVTAWNILQNSSKKKGSFYNPKWYYHTEEDYNELSSIFTVEDMNALLFDNLNNILNNVACNLDVFSSISKLKTSFKNEDFIELVYTRARSHYGQNLHDIIVERIENELSLLIKHNFVHHYMVAYELVKYIHDQQELLGSRGSIGSSFIGFLLKITEVNPLIPHYFCKTCSVFIDMSNECMSGFDLSSRVCKQCQKNMKIDGHNLNITIFLGKNGEKIPDIDLNVSTDFQKHVHEYLFSSLTNKKYSVLRSGTLLLIRKKNALLFIQKYMDIIKDKSQMNDAWINTQSYKLMDCVNAYGRHPGGLLIDETNTLHDYTVIGVSRKQNDQVLVSKIRYKWLKKYFFKIDVLGHDDPKTLKFLLDNTHVSIDDIHFNDPKILSLFKQGYVAGIPEFCTNFSYKVLNSIKPKYFSELVDISGLTHGINVWFNNNKTLIRHHKIHELVCSRDDILNILMNKYGCDFEFSYRVMEFVRNGRIKQEFEEWQYLHKELKQNNVDDWFINSLSKIIYIFPKAHACAYVISAFRIAFFKIYFPDWFYLSILNKHVEVFNIKWLILNNNELLDVLKQITRVKIKPIDRPTVNLLNILLEIRHRKNLKFLLQIPNLRYSDSKKFILKDREIFSPLCAIKGIGIKIADEIVHQRNIKFFSNKYEFQHRCKLGSVLTKLILSNSKHSFDPNIISQTKFFNDIKEVL